ncbi:ribokinase [Rhizobium sp. KVB221]|uniref:Ribokinase n=1 Tax=Rhizobium setariae TaxID=2801340 RepID=A0A936YKR1_9HYPH|nr:ribokinase [Rhizobium setariae]MBL0371373.1 ribokinase [Rhizobium setariae]
MAKAILVAGSLHHDVIVEAERLPAFDETLPGRAVRYVAGGKGRNQAAAVAHNAGKCFVAGRVGDDAQGSFLADDLREAGVDTSLLQVGKGQTTGMSVAVVNPTGDYGAVIVSGANLAFTTSDIRMPDGVGLLLLQNEIPEAVNLELARKARDAGIVTILNAAPARPLSPDIAEAIDILVVNRIEAAELTGLAIDSQGAAADAARQLCHSVGKVIVTLGGEGLVHMRAGGRPEYQPPFRVDVVSTHGAGDFFIGALASQLASGSEFEAAIHYAQAAAALFVSTDVDKRWQIRPVQIRARLGEDEL